MARDPYGESDVARKFNQKKPKPNGVGQDGDPKVAAAIMRKFGMGNLAKNSLILERSIRFLG